jgi:hypothetical protein
MRPLDPSQDNLSRLLSPEEHSRIRGFERVKALIGTGPTITRLAVGRRTTLNDGDRAHDDDVPASDISVPAHGHSLRKGEFPVLIPGHVQVSRQCITSAWQDADFGRQAQTTSRPITLPRVR